MTKTLAYPIGTPGRPWADEERGLWRSQRARHRRYDEDVVSRIEALGDQFTKVTYGRLDYAGEPYPLYALKSADWNAALPTALVTGGVHGYETSGVVGALQFLETEAAAYAGRTNLLVAPCVSPWGYERINRWNHDAVDPNRSFRPGGASLEAAKLTELVAPLLGTFLLHIDLHETTDTDESEFLPALAARDGKAHEPGVIPDGFYLVAEASSPQLAFQEAVIAAVERVTHIAPPDANGDIIGRPLIARGVIDYALAHYGMCAGVTDARYKTTTEVYPDSPRATPDICNRAQVVAVRAALDFALAAP